jgi:hypothetical protein
MQNRERSDRVALNALAHADHESGNAVQMPNQLEVCGQRECVNTRRPGRCAPGSVFVDPLKHNRRDLRVSFYG